MKNEDIKIKKQIQNISKYNNSIVIMINSAQLLQYSMIW